MDDDGCRSSNDNAYARSMRKSLRIAAVAAVVVVVGGAAVHVVARARATRTLAEYSRVAGERRAERHAEIAALRLPALRGAPVDAVCLDVYARVARANDMLRPHDRDPAAATPARGTAAAL